MASRSYFQQNITELKEGITTHKVQLKHTKFNKIELDNSSLNELA